MRVYQGAVILFCLVGCGGVDPSNTIPEREKVKDYHLYYLQCDDPTTPILGPLSIYATPPTNVLWLFFGSGSCSACNQEYTYLSTNDEMVKSYGVQTAEVLIMDDHGSCSLDNLYEYGCKKYSAYGRKVPILLDPCMKESADDYDAIPYNLVIDRNMGLAMEEIGWSSVWWGTVKRIASEASN